MSPSLIQKCSDCDTERLPKLIDSGVCQSA